MNYRAPLLGTIGLGVMTLHAPFVSAQTTQDVQLYAGYLFGDDLLDRPLSGGIPHLDDNGIFGARYTYHLTDQWGVQLGAGYSPGRVAYVAGGNNSLGLTTLDLDVQWDLLPDFELAGHKLVPYSVIGVGFGWANLDHPLTGNVGSIPVVVTESNGITAKAGLGARYYVTDRFFVGLEGRYRYLNRLVNEFGQGMNTTETTMSVGYRF